MGGYRLRWGGGGLQDHVERLHVDVGGPHDNVGGPRADLAHVDVWGPHADEGFYWLLWWCHTSALEKDGTPA